MLDSLCRMIRKPKYVMVLQFVVIGMVVGTGLNASLFMARDGGTLLEAWMWSAAQTTLVVLGLGGGLSFCCWGLWKLEHSSCTKGN